MLIDFSITNFRSIKDKQVFSMQKVGKITELPSNVIHTDKFELLRSAVIYGRNASGKSNLLLAMDILRSIVIWNSNVIKHFYTPFKLDNETNNKAVEFEINFIASDNIKYNYSISYTSEEIINEKLSFYPSKKQIPSKLFLRKKGKAISYGDRFKDNIIDIEKQLYTYQSLLSRLSFFKIESLIIPYAFFKKQLVTQLSYDKVNLLEHFISNCNNKSLPNHLENISKLLRIADTGINSIAIKNIFKEDSDISSIIMKEDSPIGKISENFKIVTYHDVYENGIKKGSVEFELKDESAGTIKLLEYGSAILDCINDGDVLMIDEMDKSLHPLLTRELIKIFNNPESNPNNAQLIFVTHDVSLLKNDLFRRDQIWFAEKNIEGSSEFYSIADIKGIRQNVPLDKYYLQGIFGATPVLNEYDFIFNSSSNE